MRIRESDPLEIFTNREGEVILKKYSPIEELGEFAQGFAESLSQVIGYTVCVTDMDQVIAVAGKGKKEYTGKSISPAMEKAIAGRKKVTAGEKDSLFIPIFMDLPESVSYIIKGEVICPIVCQGDVIGSVVILQQETDMAVGEEEMKYAQVGAYFLGGQMDA